MIIWYINIQFSLKVSISSYFQVPLVVDDVPERTWENHSSTQKAKCPAKPSMLYSRSERTVVVEMTELSLKKN